MHAEHLAIQAVVFDLDDTLYPERDYVRSGYRAVARHLRRRLGCRHPVDQWLWERFCLGHRAKAFDAMNAAFSLGLSGDQIAELVGVYRRHAPQIRPYPAAEGLLERLGRRYRLGLLSDGYLPAQRLKLAALGIEGLFDAVVFSEDLGRDAWKPSPAGFEAIRRELDVPNERCAYVADNPAKDFLAPNGLGWLTIRFVCDGQVHAGSAAPPGGEPQIVIRSLDDLETAVT